MAIPCMSVQYPSYREKTKATPKTRDGSIMLLNQIDISRDYGLISKHASLIPHSNNSDGTSPELTHVVVKYACT